jgi:hypothetical protein
MGDDKTSLELYKKSQDAADKFDYFVCAVSGSLFAYIAEHYSPKPLAIDVYLLEPISLLLLAASFICGVKRIAVCVGLIHIDQKISVCDERQDFDQHAILNRVRNKGKAQSWTWYIWRDRLLVCGFVAILAAKVLQPYGADSSAHASASAQPAHIQSQTLHSSASPIPFQLPAAAHMTNKPPK